MSENLIQSMDAIQDELPTGLEWAWNRVQEELADLQQQVDRLTVDNEKMDAELCGMVAVSDGFQLDAIHLRQQVEQLRVENERLKGKK